MHVTTFNYRPGTSGGCAVDGLERWLFSRTHLDRDAALNADILYLTRTLPQTAARLERQSAPVATAKHKREA